MAARLRQQARVCAFCGDPIDPELEAPHPLSFTVDHIQPVAYGGGMADPANARAAHRICNLKRQRGIRDAGGPEDRSDRW
jgi:hypothetical protein